MYISIRESGNTNRIQFIRKPQYFWLRLQVCTPVVLFSLSSYMYVQHRTLVAEPGLLLASCLIRIRTRKPTANHFPRSTSPWRRTRPRTTTRTCLSRRRPSSPWRPSRSCLRNGSDLLKIYWRPLIFRIPLLLLLPLPRLSLRHKEIRSDVCMVELFRAHITLASEQFAVQRVFIPKLRVFQVSC